jgi:monofunctional biosynthetic peptidoglycan transglycosylase
MGEGIYGIEAASIAYYGKHAHELTRGESASIAAILPSPRQRDPAQPSAYLQGRQRDILSLMRKIETVNMGYRSPGKSN